MTTNSQSIYASLAAAQSEIPVIAKESKAVYGKYADFDSIINVVRPILNKHGLFLMQKATSTDVGVGITTVIYNSAGENIVSDPLIIPVQGGKGSVAQQCGSVITYAKRYSLCALLGIATGDDNDGASISKAIIKTNAVLEANARKAAKTGLDAYQNFYKTLTHSERKELCDSGLHIQLKKEAEKVGA